MASGSYYSFHLNYVVPSVSTSNHHQHTHHHSVPDNSYSHPPALFAPSYIEPPCSSNGILHPHHNHFHHNHQQGGGNDSVISTSSLLPYYYCCLPPSAAPQSSGVAVPPPSAREYFTAMTQPTCSTSHKMTEAVLSPDTTTGLTMCCIKLPHADRDLANQHSAVLYPTSTVLSTSKCNHNNNNKTTTSIMANLSSSSITTTTNNNNNTSSSLPVSTSTSSVSFSQAPLCSQNFHLLNVKQEKHIPDNPAVTPSSPLHEADSHTTTAAAATAAAAAAMAASMGMLSESDLLAADSHTPESAFHRYQRKLDGLLCQVCGDLAAGFHHGAYVCEACKKFFMRHSSCGKKATSACSYGGHCVIRKARRSKCQCCRFLKCIAVGMRIKDTYMGDDFDISKIPCRVCGNNSSGFHFGALTCEGCKGFFRRTDKPEVHLTCKSSNNCVIRCGDRNACKSCRYKKCREVGMSRQGSRIGRQPNAVKYHCAQEIRSLQLAHTSDPDSSIAESTDHKESPSLPQLLHHTAPLSSSSPSSHHQHQHHHTIHPHESSVLRNTIMLTTTLPSPHSTSPPTGGSTVVPSLSNSSADALTTNSSVRDLDLVEVNQHILLDLEKLRRGVQRSAEYLDTPKEKLKSHFAIEPIPYSQSDIDVVWDHMMKHFTMHTNHIVHFAKSVVGFSLLDISVRRKLVRDSMYAIMMLELSRDYNLAADEYNYFDFSRQERDVILHNFPTFEGLVKHLRFSGRMLKPLELDSVELTLLCIIELFKNHNDVPDYNIAKQLYDSYRQILDDYISNKSPFERERRRESFVRISNTLDQMNREHHEIISQLRLSRSHLKFPELYVDMFKLSPQDRVPVT